MKIFLFIAALMISWDMILHLVSWIFGHTHKARGWFLFPTFNSWTQYDKFWTCYHSMILILILASLIS